MIEVRLWDVRVLLRPDLDQHGKRLDVRQPKHLDQKRGLVAADPVLVLERDANVMRLIAGRLRLDRQPQVADLLRDELEERLDLLLALVRG